VVGGNPQLIISDGITDAAPKNGFLGVRHYTNAEEALIIASGVSLSATNYQK